MSRTTILVFASLLAACTSRPLAGGTETGSEHSDSSGSASSSDSEGSPTGTHTDTDADPTDTDADPTDTDADPTDTEDSGGGSGCPPAPGFRSHFVSIDSVTGLGTDDIDWDQTCSVIGVSGDLEVEALIGLACLDGESPIEHQLKLRMDSDLTPALPFVATQEVSLSVRYRGNFTGGHSIVVRDASQQILLAWHHGANFPGSGDGAPEPEFFAPLSIAVVDGVCSSIWDPGDFLPNACPETRQVGVEFRQQPATEPVVVLDRSSALVPGEPPGYAAVTRAYLNIDCEETYEGYFEFGYLTGVE